MYLEHLTPDEALRLECARITGLKTGAQLLYNFIKEGTNDAEILRAARTFAEAVNAKA